MIRDIADEELEGYILEYLESEWNDEIISLLLNRPSTTKHICNILDIRKYALDTENESLRQEILTSLENLIRLLILDSYTLDEFKKLLDNPERVSYD